MFSKLLLYVSAQQATAAHWRSGKLLFCQGFANNEEGWASFNNLLASYDDTPVYLLVDAVEEDYRSDTLPHTIGGTRQEMLARKLKQIYRNTPFTMAWLQGRETDKRRDDRFLFAAMTNPDLLNPWLEVLQHHQSPIAGVYLLPMVSQSLLAKLQIQAPTLLLVSEHSAGLRQSFFQNQKLKVSRLTPLQPATDGPAGQADSTESRFTHYTEEIEKTRFFLNSQRLLTRDEKLFICVLDQENTLEALCHSLNTDPALQCLHLSQADIFNRLGISPSELKPSCINVPHLLTLGNTPPAISLAPTALTRGFAQYRARFGLYGLGIAIALISAIWSGSNLYYQSRSEKQIQILTTQTRQQEALYQEVAKQFPESPVSAENLLKAVEIAKKIQSNSHNPTLLMEIVSHALDANPAISPNRLKWKISQQTSDQEDGTSSSQQAPQNNTPPSGGTTEKWQLGYIDGEVKPFNGDYRAAITLINHFADSIRQDTHVESVSILKLPLDVNSASGLSGTTMEKTSQTTSAQFKLKILLKPGTGTRMEPTK
ncbi:hypothetical protein [Sulfurirhabdus autotrophica]|uniref:Uncharacterized protein n=1 Tax=Sulfurirhabdus autotrophica TaxID=1706046 RepID=A0A4R3XRT7_9PROT|nr:hypothetical protein [Sulfurirhabdus autotrophica]TCV80072.1 hypothetical protein EDC63_1317 [Sulfurirhabdus autotrophica]